MNNGEMTAQVARVLAAKFQSRADILFDHGDQEADGADRVGVIHARFGDTLNRGALLADIDIAVVLPRSHRAILLIEVEESAASPKKLLGDVFASLFAEHFSFQRRRDLEVGSWTTMLVLAQSEKHGHLPAFLAAKLDEIKFTLMGKVVIDTFKDGADLERKLTQHIESALAHS